MKTTLALLFALASLCMAEVKTYNILIAEAGTIGSTEVKPGNYKVKIDGEKATFTNQKTQFETAVKVEMAEKKYDRNAIQATSENGSKKIQRIEFRGSKVAIAIN